VLVLGVPETIEEMRRPITRVEYERMVEAGLFEGERVELLYGVIVRMTPHGPPHDATLERLSRALARLLPDDVSVRVQMAFAASDGSQPEPDLAIVPRRDYDDGHPRKALLVIEVAVSSISVDLGAKAALYAESGVPEHWVFDVESRQVVVHREPRRGRWGSVSRVGPDGVLSIAGISVLPSEVIR
jgi:Uma2 family endonuclease